MRRTLTAAAAVVLALAACGGEAGPSGVEAGQYLDITVPCLIE